MLNSKTIKLFEFCQFHWIIFILPFFCYCFPTLSLNILSKLILYFFGEGVPESNGPVSFVIFQVKKVRLFCWRANGRVFGYFTEGNTLFSYQCVISSLTMTQAVLSLWMPRVGCNLADHLMIILYQDMKLIILGFGSSCHSVFTFKKVT